MTRRQFRIAPRLAAVAVAASSVVLGACTVSDEGWGYGQAREQPRADIYEASPVFPDGKAMQAPPAGTVPFGAEADDPGVRTGMRDGVPVTTMPLPVTERVLVRGAGRYAIYCAPCHGEGGYGGGLVGLNFAPPRPPPLRTAAVADMAAGALFDRITHGGARMPAYAAQLPVADRWAVVAYVQRLRAQPTTAAMLADSVRAARRAASRPVTSPGAFRATAPPGIAPTPPAAPSPESLALPTTPDGASAGPDSGGGAG